MAEPAAKDPKKEVRRLEEEAKKEAKAKEEAAKKEAKMKEEEAKRKEKEDKLREKEREKDQKRAEKEAKEQDQRDKEAKKKEAKQKEEDAKKEAKQKEEEAKRERKLKEKQEKLDKAKARKGSKDEPVAVRRHSKYKLEGGIHHPAAKIFGNPLALVMSPKSDGTFALPQLVVNVINFLQDHLKTEGLFRISGSMQEITAWRTDLDHGKEVTFPPTANPHSVAGIMKLFLRELPEPLLTYGLYEDWCSFAEIPPAEKTQRLQCLQDIMPRMPKPNTLLLTELIRLLKAVSVFSSINKMTPANLGLVIGPNVMRGTDEQSMNMMYPCDVTSFMIDNSEAFISIAGGGAVIVETGVEEYAEEPLEEEQQEGESDNTGAGSARSEMKAEAPAAAGGSSMAMRGGMPASDSNGHGLVLPPPMMDLPPPPPPEEL